MITPNLAKFRKKLDSGELCLGVAITIADPAVTEAICESVDFLWIDLEHNPTNLETLLAHLIAARAAGAAALVRVPSQDVGWIKRVLDTGAEGIIMPQSQSAQEVREFVSACRYPPMGTRGFGPRRPTNYGRLGGDAYLENANKNLFVAAQIETVSALHEIDEIVNIDGLDSLVVGPNDLSGSMGMLGKTEHPQVLDAIGTIAGKARGAGLYVGAGMGAQPDYARKLAGLGVQWIQCGGDFEFMIRFAEQLYTQIRGDGPTGSTNNGPVTTPAD